MNKNSKDRMRYKSLWLLLGLTALVSVGCGEGGGGNQEMEAGASAKIMETGAVETGTAEYGTTKTGIIEIGTDEIGANETETDKKETDETGTAETGIAETGDPFLFSDLEGREFYFSSGAGGWYEVLHIHGDGTFDGHFQDSDMGVTGDGYPNGTLYYSDYTGSFTEPQQLDDTTWTFQTASIRYVNQMGVEEIKDETNYIYTDSYGLGEAEALNLYLPGADIAGLPEEYRSWVGYYDLNVLEETKLPFYGLYNVDNQTGFSSYTYEKKDAYSQAWKRIEKAEEQAAELQIKFQSTRTQMEMNQVSGEIYAVWDDALNSIWGILKDNLSQDAMASLTEDERAWIAMKEKNVETAAADVAGGSMEAMVRNRKAAELTRDRVYVLVKYLPEN